MQRVSLASITFKGRLTSAGNGGQRPLAQASQVEMTAQRQAEPEEPERGAKSPEGQLYGERMARELAVLRQFNQPSCAAWGC